MFPFWDKVVAPVLELAGAHTIVEIGALRGENTERMLERLGPDAELHVIDPVPEFDPAEHEARFPGRYVFHRDLSLDVLPELPPMDAAIVDGDHNWYTVVNECRQLAATARAADRPLPVMVFHDVSWPYGRRDLYYEPSQIPDEFRQEYDHRGIRRGRRKLAVGGGMNRQLAHAVVEGGPRNGVMTGVEDFIAEHDEAVRLVVLPLYFGLAIVVEQQTLDRRPRLGEFLDWLESTEGAQSLIELGEEIRTDEATWSQLVTDHHTGQLDLMAARYLGLLKAALLGELGWENELRVGYLAECVHRGRPVDPETLRDPVRGLREGARRSAAINRAGAHDATTGASIWFPPSSMGRIRMEHLERCLDAVREGSVDGDLVGVGVGRGGSGAFLRGYLEAHRMFDRVVWLADRFSGRVALDTDMESPLPGWARGFPELDADLDVVRDMLARHELLDERVRFLQGDPVVALRGASIERIALLHIGASAAVDIEATLDGVYDAVVPGGFVVVEDADADVAEAIAAFRDRCGIVDPIRRVDDRGLCWRVESPVTRPAREPTPPPSLPDQQPGHPPLAPTAVEDPVDLSMLVVFYEMKREAARTLHSLSRAYQRDVDDLSFEVLVLDNGSSDGQRLDPDWVGSFGPEFRLIDMGPDAAPSPTRALNRAMLEARGDHIGFMIDGAHVVTPGIYRSLVTAEAAYGRSVVATQQFYVGPGQQSDVIAEGYDQGVEDRLFESIEWPADGYRLFDIGTFIGDRDWFDGISESNCLIVPRATLCQIGGFDDGFDEPSGGFTNLDFFERVAAAPDVALVTPLGEGSFHQMHAGTTTNQPSPDERFARIRSYQSKYERLRGKPYKGPRRTIQYVGALHGGAKRTRARRRTAAAFLTAGRAGAEGEPTSPAPMPTDTRDEFTEAYWNTLGWRKTSWLGHPMRRPATDLFTYQEILARVRPDLVVDVGTRDGARAFFLASICELLGSGQVVTIGPETANQRPTHARLHQVTGPTDAPEVVAQVRERFTDGATGLVVLGSWGRPARLLREFEAYRDFVSVGSYLVVERTAVNGHPIWPEHGPGPSEAVVRITNANREFIIDHEVEVHGMSFNPGGYLKRAR